jgi:hypothetical protein
MRQVWQGRGCSTAACLLSLFSLHCSWIPSHSFHRYFFILEWLLAIDNDICEAAITFLRDQKKKNKEKYENKRVVG